MPTGVASWSQTPAANASADSNVNMAEGMAPAQVNDGVRALMASVARYRDDLAGLTTTGSATAFAVSSNQGFTSLAALDGKVIAIVPHTTSGASPTLSVDALTAKPLRMQAGTAAPAGAFVQGTPYPLTYSNANNEFVAHAVVVQTPSGMIVPYGGSIAPSGWFLCFGQAVSRTTNAALFAAVGTTFGAGDGSTTFNLPDLRGRVIAGVDNMGGAAASRLTASFFGAAAALGAAGGLESHQLTAAQLAAHAHPSSLNDPGHFHNYVNFNTTASFTGGGADCAAFRGSQTTTTNTTGITINNASAGGDAAHNNTQPTMQLNYIIKA